MKVLIAIVTGSLVAITSPAPAQQRDAPEKAVEPRDKIICKRFVETGSLVRGYRMCKPRWEWERNRDNLRAFSVSDSCRSRAEPDPLKAGGGCAL